MWDRREGTEEQQEEKFVIFKRLFPLSVLAARSDTQSRYYPSPRADF